MNKNELIESLKFLEIENELIEIEIFALLKDNETPLKLDVKATELHEISKLFNDSISKNILNKLISDDFSLLPISSADERKNCFYLYDFDVPEELSVLDSVISNDHIELFNFKHNKLEEIEALIIVMAVGENEISIYKKVYPVEVIGRGGYILGMLKANERFERFKEQLLRITAKVQIFKVNGEIIVVDLDIIEKFFGFHDVIKREAEISVGIIDKLQILSDIDSLKDLVGDISFARKLSNIARNSPVLKLKIPNVDILSFSKGYPAMADMTYSHNGSKFNLTSKKLKNLFLKLLNDDLLTSELTKLHYDSLAKDNVDI